MKNHIKLEPQNEKNATKKEWERKTFLVNEEKLQGETGTVKKRKSRIRNNPEMIKYKISIEENKEI